MQAFRAIPMFLCLVGIAGGLRAQSQPADTVPAMPKAEPVINHVPAGAAGYVVVNNIRQGAAKIEKFLAQTGLDRMVGLAEMSGGLVGLLKDKAGLGDGFNPNGGFAAVMLDPQQFGVDLAELMPMGGPPTEQANELAKPRKVPFVLLVPGTGLEAIFPEDPTAPAGEFRKITLDMGPMFAGKCGGYVALSPTAEALSALLKAEKKTGEELSKSHKAAIDGSDIAIHIDMRIAGPIYIKMLDKLNKQLTAQRQTGMVAAGPGSMLSPMLGFYREMISQIRGVTVTGRFVETGLVFSELVAVDPAGDWGKIVASCKPTGDKLLDRLPDLPYILAAGSSGGGQPELSRKTSLDFLDKFMSTEALSAVPEETRTRAKKLLTDYDEQVTAVQFAIGGAPQGSGVFGLACVIKCKDAEALKALLAETAEVTEGFIKALVGPDEPDLEDLSIAYAKNVDTIGEIAVDAIEIIHPELAEALAEDEALQKVLGEDKLRVQVAAADAKTVVVTFGGATPFLTEALKTARNGGAILQREELAVAMKHMPENRVTLVLFSPGNLLDVVAAAVQTIAPDQPPLPFKIQTKTPVAIGAGVSGNDVEVVVYVPNGLIKDVVGIVPVMFGGMRGPPPGMAPAAPMEGAEDF